jgi:hypothetical protein
MAKRRVSRRSTKTPRRATKTSRRSTKTSRRSTKTSRRSTKTSRRATKKLALKSSIHEYDTVSTPKNKKRPSKLGNIVRRTAQKKIKKSKRKASPYNKFVKTRFAVHKKENPGLRAPDIMKKIGKEWRERSSNASTENFGMSTN